MSIVNGFLTLKMKTVHFRLSEKASRCEQKGMSAYPSIVAKPMAVEPTTALESAAAQLEMDQQVLYCSGRPESQGDSHSRRLSPPDSTQETISAQASPRHDGQAQG